MTFAAEDIVQSMCENAGLMGGLHPSRCSDPNPEHCRYHQGVEDAFEVMQQTLNANALREGIEPHEFHDGSDGEMECSECGDGPDAAQHVDANYEPLKIVTDR